MDDRSGRLEGLTLTLLRVGAGFAYFSHGAQKFLGWFGGFGPDGGTADLMTRFGAAGVIETLCGAAIILGVLTRPFAFFAAGQMAVTYIWMHAVRQNQLFWWDNGGELSMVFAFVWLYFAARGAGPHSLDAFFQRRWGWVEDEEEDVQEEVAEGVA